MADRRTRGMTGSDLGRTTAARAAAIAEQLHHECSVLLELYVSKGATVSHWVQPASRSQSRIVPS